MAALAPAPLLDLDASFDFVAPVQLGHALAPAAGPPSYPQLTVSIDVGNGELGTGWYPTLDAPVNANVNRQALGHLAQQILTRDVVGGGAAPAGAGNVPKQETLVAIERLVHTRTRIAHVVGHAVLAEMPALAVFAHRQIRCGTAAREELDAPERDNWDFYTDFKSKLAPESRQRAALALDLNAQLVMPPEDVWVQSLTSTAAVKTSTLYALLCREAVKSAREHVWNRHHVVVPLDRVLLIVTHPDHYDQPAVDVMVAAACRLPIPPPNGGGAANDDVGLSRNCVRGVREGFASFLSQFASSQIQLQPEQVVLTADAGHRTLDVTAVVLRELDPLQLQVLSSQGFNMGGILVEASMQRMLEDYFLTLWQAAAGQPRVERHHLRAEFVPESKLYRFLVLHALEDAKRSYRDALVHTWAEYNGNWQLQLNLPQCLGFPLPLHPIGAIHGVQDDWYGVLRAALPGYAALQLVAPPPSDQVIPVAAAEPNNAVPLPDVGTYHGNDHLFKVRAGEVAANTEVVLPYRFVQHHLNGHALAMLDKLKRVLRTVQAMRFERGIGPQVGQLAEARVGAILVSGNGASSVTHHNQLPQLRDAHLLEGQQQRAYEHVEHGSIHVIRGGVLAGLYAESLVTRTRVTGAWGVRLRFLKKSYPDVHNLCITRIDNETRTALGMNGSVMHVLVPLTGLEEPVAGGHEIIAGNSFTYDAVGDIIVEVGQKASLDVYNVQFPIPRLQSVVDAGRNAAMPLTSPVFIYYKRGVVRRLICQRYKDGAGALAAAAVPGGNPLPPLLYSNGEPVPRIIDDTEAVARLIFENHEGKPLNVRFSVRFDVHGSISAEVAEFANGAPTGVVYAFAAAAAVQPVPPQQQHLANMVAAAGGANGDGGQLAVLVAAAAAADPVAAVEDGEDDGAGDDAMAM